MIILAELWNDWAMPERIQKAEKCVGESKEEKNSWTPKMQVIGPPECRLSLFAPRTYSEKNGPKPPYFFNRMVNCELENIPSYKLILNT